MPLICLGLSHHTAPVEVREQHAFAPARVTETLIALHDYQAVEEAALLSTCGRVEIYAEVNDYENGALQLKNFLQNFRHGEVADLESYLYTLLGVQAAEHLLRVSTGLDSMLIGEAEILGQVKDAYLQAHRARSIGTTLHRLFREALRAGKAARSQTSIGDQYVSVATAAVAAAKVRHPDLHAAAVAVIGAGAMGNAVVRRLRAEGTKDILLANRSTERAARIVSDLGIGEVVELPALNELLRRSDVIVTSSGASHFLLTASNVSAALPARDGRPLTLIDIAVPRDVEPEAGALPGVELLGIDELHTAVGANLEQRLQAVPQVEEIITEYVRRFVQWYETRETVPVVRSLTERAESIRRAEIERLFARCPGLGERERMLITGMSLTVISKLLHTVVTRIRDKALTDHAEAQSQARVLDELFDLRVAPPRSPADDT